VVLESTEKLKRMSTRCMGRFPRGNNLDLIEPLSRYPRKSAAMIRATDTSETTQLRVRRSQCSILERPY
jgi:hypothetical protein